ncbi:MAG TPA: hypothetical protein VD994_09230, partial [Prosthecobacter sp.]|nr:hypothetical protein [Prosthecobacter sp.]
MSAPVALKCPSCASPLSADDLDLAQGIATCGYCRAALTFPAATGDSRVIRDRLPMPLPPRVTLQPTMHGLEIRRRWFTPVAFFLLLFCIVWD